MQSVFIDGENDENIGTELNFAVAMQTVSHATSHVIQFAKIVSWLRKLSNHRK